MTILGNVLFFKDLYPGGQKVLDPDPKQCQKVNLLVMSILHLSDILQSTHYDIQIHTSVKWQKNWDRNANIRNIYASRKNIIFE